MADEEQNGGVPSPTEKDPLRPPDEGRDWTGLSSAALPVEEVATWIVLPSCGATVVFTGTSRDHSVGRDGVTMLEYEAYEEQVVPKLDEIAGVARERWPDLGRMVLLHRVGKVPLTEAAVVVAASAPHRTAAFEAARFGIDTLKETVPIWKREDWSAGSSWGLEAQHLVSVDELIEDGGSAANGTAEPMVDSGRSDAEG